MKKNIIPAVRLTLVCFVFLCGVYTTAIWAVAQLAPGQGEGQTITESGKTYHENVGQRFTQDKYFWSRPSAVEYDATGSGGSNLGPSNPVYLQEIEERIKHFLKHNPEVNRSEIPSDLVTASGSGLDPHISIQAANVQAKRIAGLRGITESNIRKLIISNTEKPFLGLFGTERINVLKLNLALDKLNKIEI
ncbi:K(+)-transporting ATPase subunit C [Olivibacter sp. SDN3]|uniref:K(+)-transporting ATPase subunit C n=1 Tax=Olivibacter sp. SDN3 TaxID=2764720 RepID=UPI0016518F37|nr:K(+)-transporting ATPase subunit C [Olivibacter sp. SDN3]QNL49800.1 K(+)-transporting ATPase subunit C [Olivibacter sp. SDN3]